MTSEERQRRIRELVAGLDSSEFESLISNLRTDITEEQGRRAEVDALLRERHIYESRGDGDRVKLVDEQLAHNGYVPEAIGSGKK